MSDRPKIRADDTFQQLLLQVSVAAADGPSSDLLIRLFCRATRKFFQVDGAYFWECGADELIGVQADGMLSDRIPGLRLKIADSATMNDAIREHRTVFANRLSISKSVLVPEFRIRAIMASPVVVANEVAGVALFVHASAPDFFNQELAARATILAGQLGSLLEATRTTQRPPDGNRRAEILAQVANTLQTAPNPTDLMAALAEHIRVLLRASLVGIFLREGYGFHPKAVAGESQQMAESGRAGIEGKGLQFARDMATRANAAGETIAITIESSAHGLGDRIPGGMALAVPFRAARTQGAVLVYPRRDRAFTQEEKALASSVAGLVGMARSTSDLSLGSLVPSQEPQQLLEITAELSSLPDPDRCMQQLSIRAAEFLGFKRACVGLLENEAFHIKWKAEDGRAEQISLAVPDGAATQSLKNGEVFSTDSLGTITDTNLDVIAAFKVRQLLAVPLLDTSGQIMGMLGVLDRLDRAGISPEDIRRARLLAARAGVILERTRNLQIARLKQQRLESLMDLALAVNSAPGLEEFANVVLPRMADMAAASSALLVAKRGAAWEALAFEGHAGSPDTMLPRRFSHAVADIVSRQSGIVISSSAAELFGPPAASVLGWDDCILVRLSAGEELTGVVCLANRGTPLGAEDEQLLAAAAVHVSAALENARRFSQLEHSNRHWIETFDAISDFIVVHDGADNVLRVNRSLANFIGVSPQSLIGVNMSALLALEVTQKVSCPFCRAAGEVTSEYVHPGLDRTYLVSTSRVHDASGETLQTIHVLKDISDRREVERRYQELFGNIQEGLFFATPEGRFVEVNDALVRMLGYSSREELLQTDIPHSIFASPESFREFADQMQRHGVRNHEETLRHRTGALVHVLMNAFAVRDSHERILQYRGLMLDISGLKTFQSELQRERDFSGKILNNTQSLILVADSAGMVSYANRRWAEMGYQQKQLLDLPMMELVAPRTQASFTQAFRSTLAGNQVDNLELQILHEDGQIGQFSVNLSPMRDEQGNVSSLVVVMSDITDSASLHAKLMHAEKLAAVGQLVSGVAHEVNNPLTAILGFADLLMENPDVPESARKDLRVILQEAQRTKQIVQNLLSFARQMPPQRKAVQLNSILHRTVQLRAYDFHSNGVEVNELFDPALPDVVGDSHQLQQVFLNILNNAYDAVRDLGRPPRIDIATSHKGNMVQILFRDNGHGIAFPDHIFDPFFTTKDVGKGTGLGLSICYGIVHEHGGEILCQNNADSEGATFIVRLRAASEMASLGAVAGEVQR